MSTYMSDTGERTVFSTGANKEIIKGNGRFDLLPHDVVADIIATCGFSKDIPYANILIAIDEFRETGETSALATAVAQFILSTVTVKFSETDLNKTCLNYVWELSKHYEGCAEKYPERSWQRGIPLHNFIDSALRHLTKYYMGWTDEPHDRAFLWNMVGCIWTMNHVPEMDDFTVKGAYIDNASGNSEVV